MSPKDASIWCFTHTKKEHLSIDILTLKSARDFVSTIPRDEFQFWMVHRKDVSNQAIEYISMLPYLLEKSKVSSKIISIDPESLKRKSERRSHRRIPARMTVIVAREREVFQACSKDISMGGVLLDAPLPRSFLFHKCKIIISSSDRSLNIEFEALILEASIRGSRIMFNNVNSKDLKELKEWIEFRLAA